MSETTSNLALPYILAGQAQKHVTHNEALRLLDGIVQLTVLDRDLTVPPISPADGAAYLVPAGASGVWASWVGDIALRADGGWLRLIPRVGWRVFVQDEDALLVRTTVGWGSVLRAQPEVRVAQGALGAFTGMGVLEETLGPLSGASVVSTIVIPDRAIVLGVSTRTTVAITGAASFDCGIAGQPSKFGGALGIAAGSTNRGVIGPEAFYAPTAVVLQANGGAFTGGSVRIAIHYLTVGIPA